MYCICFHNCNGLALMERVQSSNINPFSILNCVETAPWRFSTLLGILVINSCYLKRSILVTSRDPFLLASKLREFSWAFLTHVFAYLAYLCRCGRCVCYCFYSIVCWSPFYGGRFYRMGMIMVLNLLVLVHSSCTLELLENWHCGHFASLIVFDFLVPCVAMWTNYGCLLQSSHSSYGCSHSVESFQWLGITTLFNYHTREMSLLTAY